MRDEPTLRAHAADADKARQLIDEITNQRGPIYAIKCRVAGAPRRDGSPEAEAKFQRWEAANDEELAPLLATYRKAVAELEALVEKLRPVAAREQVGRLGIPHVRRLLANLKPFDGLEPSIGLPLLVIPARDELETLRLRLLNWADDMSHGAATATPAQVAALAAGKAGSARRDDFIRPGDGIAMMGFGDVRDGRKRRLYAKLLDALPTTEKRMKGRITLANYSALARLKASLASRVGSEGDWSAAVDDIAEIEARKAQVRAEKQRK